MADKRMFSCTLVDTDLFNDFPLGVQALYFRLGLEADDDGFVMKPRSIVKKIGASMDDLELLVNHGYLIRFESGVTVITHWKVNNFLARDRYKMSPHIKERNLLFVLPNSHYSLIDEEGAIPLSVLQNRAYPKLKLKELEDYVNDAVNEFSESQNADKISKEKVREEEDMVSDIISAYMECGNLAPMEELNKNAMACAISALLDTFTKDDIISAIRKANTSSFLTGRTEKGFRANLAWILKPERLAKILNGEYDDYSTTSDDSGFKGRF